MFYGGNMLIQSTLIPLLSLRSLVSSGFLVFVLVLQASPSLANGGDSASVESAPERPPVAQEREDVPVSESLETAVVRGAGSQSSAQIAEVDENGQDDSLSRSKNISSVVVTAFGAFLGFFLALLADRLRQKLRDQRTFKALVKVLRYAVEHNQGLLGQLQKEYKQGSWIAFYPLNLSSFEGFSSINMAEHLSTERLRMIYKYRFELLHLQRKLDLVHNCIMLDDKAAANTRRATDESIKQHLPEIMKLGQRVVEALKDH